MFYGKLQLIYNILLVICQFLFFVVTNNTNLPNKLEGYCISMCNNLLIQLRYSQKGMHDTIHMTFYCELKC